MLTNLRQSTMSLGTETAEQLHHVVIVLQRRIADAECPIEQIGVRAIEQPRSAFLVRGTPFVSTMWRRLEAA